MTFQSVAFLGLFLPAVLLLHWAGPRRSGWQNGILVAASWLFFYSWGPGYLPLLLGVTALHYGAGHALGALRPQEGEGATPAGRWLLAAALAVDLGLLGAFKYLGFLASSANSLGAALGVPLSLSAPAWALPLGISFWTLQQVGYLLDVHHGRLEPCRSPLAFAAFSAFFAQAQAGPIPRSDLLGQLGQARQPSADDLRTGAFRFFRGFVARFFVAAVLGQLLVDPVFAQAGQPSAAAHWLALLGYAGQVFCDFAGYSDMAIGVGLLLGVRLPENFDAPLLAGNILDLWRRWHMSLTGWLFDYVYSPLMTGSGWLRGRLDAGFVITFLVSGLWHGAAWTFVLWGGLQGLGLVVHHRFDEAYRGLCRRDRAWLALRRSLPWKLGAWAVTQGFFVLTLVPFRARSLAEAGRFFAALWGGGPARLPQLAPRDLLNLAAACVLFLGFHAFHRRRLRLPPLARGLAYGLLIVYLSIFMPLARGTFIYAQF